jgi:hypothetical protein
MLDIENVILIAFPRQHWLREVPEYFVTGLSTLPVLLNVLILRVVKQVTNKEEYREVNQQNAQLILRLIYY